LFCLDSFPRDKAINSFFEEMNRFDSFNDGNRDDEVEQSQDEKKDGGSAIGV
jgi:hypothetical protein